MEENRTSTFIDGFLWGALTGFVLGVLFAPQSGVETREMLKEKGKELGTKAKEVAKDVKAKGRDILTGKGVEIQEEVEES